MINNILHWPSVKQSYYDLNERPNLIYFDNDDNFQISNTKARKEFSNLKDFKFNYTLSKYFDKEIKIVHNETEICSINLALHLIADEINYSKYILDLKQGWDDEDAQPINKSIWIEAVKFLCLYANNIFVQSNSLVIQSPEINPCKDGSIDISWRTKNARMLVNIKERNGKINGYFYFDLYNDINQRKGIINLNSFEEDVAVWMKNLI